MPFYEIIIEPKQKGWNIKEHYRIMAAYFLVHSMCWCISLLALACAWDQEPISTMRIEKDYQQLPIPWYTICASVFLYQH